MPGARFCLTLDFVPRANDYAQIFLPLSLSLQRQSLGRHQDIVLFCWTGPIFLVLSHTRPQQGLKPANHR